MAGNTSLSSRPTRSSLSHCRSLIPSLHHSEDVMSLSIATRVAAAALALLATSAAAQAPPPPADPLVKENATVKLAAHTYVIPDGNVGLVPNVGIIVGTRGTLVIDPGLGRRNGETVLR